MKLIIAITGASGAIYARQVVEYAAASPMVQDIAVIVSRTAHEVMAYEGETLPRSDKITFYDNDDLFAPPASGSARYDAMIAAPCSAGTMGRIAAGTAQTLIERAADVMLKERRRLVLLLRETPLSAIHLDNMTALTRAGAVVMPASPSFYSHPADIEALCREVSLRALSLAGVDAERYEWGNN